MCCSSSAIETISSKIQKFSEDTVVLKMKEKLFIEKLRLQLKRDGTQ